ncbi:hypothetical protein [Spirillospora sp. NPDC048824]
MPAHPRARLPPSGPHAGRTVTGHAALDPGWWWFMPLSIAAAALTARF